MRLIVIICMAILFMPVSTFGDESKVRLSELKSFFTSPEQRVGLDRLRAAGVFGSVDDSQSSSAVVRKPLEVKLNGVVYSETGKPVIWVNDKSTLKSEAIDQSIRVKSSALKTESTKVPVKVNKQWLKIKPGQTWNESHNQVQENYQINQTK